MRYLKRRWVDEAVVYVSDSGETHLFGALAAYILEALERGPASFNALLSKIRELLECAEQEKAVGLLHEVLDKLSKLGLIQVQEEAHPDSLNFAA